ncbi:Alanine--tRNA ligase [Actinidia chinensis var. chinensis]|uniref:Alanine--tRNA ligase n=1 Tax=Actinidia chinensis var. chinensis TaxID=1590841 RepID=A0A2R6R591_ACTCC|nr:Alanine--tRNA ligase [Actinidia chinensis var. chinensis]
MVSQFQSLLGSLLGFAAADMSAAAEIMTWKGGWKGSAGAASMEEFLPPRHHRKTQSRQQQKQLRSEKQVEREESITSSIIRSHLGQYLVRVSLIWYRIEEELISLLTESESESELDLVVTRNRISNK